MKMKLIAILKEAGIVQLMFYLETSVITNLGSNLIQFSKIVCTFLNNTLPIFFKYKNY